VPPPLSGAAAVSSKRAALAGSRRRKRVSSYRLEQCLTFDHDRGAARSDQCRALL
jgi:hypothetical protein